MMEENEEESEQIPKIINFGKKNNFNGYNKNKLVYL